MTKNSPHPIFLALTLAATLVFAARPAPAATTKQVNDAIDKAKAYLYSLQKNGIWDDTATQPSPADMLANPQNPKGGQWTGPTALAVYALLSAGDKGTDEKLVPAIEFLKKNQAYGVYALGIRMQVWLHLPPTPEVKAAAKKDLDLLLKSVKTEGSAAGMYNYVYDKPGGTYSHSRSQYGVLGVWAGEQMGFEVDTRYWELVEKGWLSHQAPDGGWTYQAPKETQIANTPGMTTVGIATLFITQDYTRNALACNGNLLNPAIDRGLKWMGEHMDMVATDKKYPRDFHYITLYAVERIGVAAGLKYFNGVDWYKKGCDWLLTKQNSKGGFAPGGLGGPIADIAFPILFLSRGRAPIAFAKLDYSKGQTGASAPGWNQRPRDVANLTRWIGSRVEQHPNWQVVPTSAPLSDMLDSPIIYVAGTNALNFDDTEKAKLKAYVEAGGMIVGSGECNAGAFNASFRKLATELFPAYEFRELPQDHPLYNTAFPRSKWRTKQSMMGLTNGVRELMLLIPSADPGKQWQSRGVMGKEEYWQMGGAIFLYASESKNLAYRGDNHLVPLDKKITATRSLAIHRVEHPANWNPEPAGWDRINNIVHNDQKVDLKFDTVKLGAGQLPAGGIAHITGTAGFTMSEEKRAELKKFVEGGGTLLVDAAGGATGFATSAEEMLNATFGGGSLKVLPPGHPLYSITGKKIDSVRYRRAAFSVLGTLRTPRLQGIEINGRLAVIYSREDLSAGMVGESMEGIVGYEPESVAELMTAIVAYVAGPDKTAKPATAPAGDGKEKTTTTKPPAKAKAKAKGATAK